MNETFVTFQGWVGNDVNHRTPGGVSVSGFRVAVTPRVKRGGKWQDGETTWYSVTAWRTLADHVRDSVKKGDAVLVHGRLRTELWQREGAPPVTTLHVEASLVGHDLSRGTSVFLKAQRPERPEADFEDEVAELIHEQAETEPLDAWGEPKVTVPDDSAA